MEFIPRTAEEILEEIYSYSSTQESRVEGTFTYDVFASNSIEFQKLELELSEAYKAAFAQTAWADYLDMKAAEHGVIRRPANKAVGSLTVTGTGTVNAGALFATENGTRFIATETAQIVDVGTINIEAVEAGASGNVAAGAINKIPLSIPGIQSVINDEPTVDGYDQEDDDTLRERLLDKVRKPATSGNPREYEQWALEIAGVGAARCIRCPYGAGTVKVILVDSNLDAANAELIQRVKEHIDELRPVGILNGEVYIVSAQPVTINISADVKGAADVDAFTAAVNKYFLSLTKATFDDVDSERIVSASRIAHLIIEAGVEHFDYLTLKLNNQTADVVLGDEEFPKLGTVNLH